MHGFESGAGQAQTIQLIFAASPQST